MNNDTKYQAYPNIARVARELASYENPYRMLNALLAVLGANPELMKDGGDRT